MTLDLEPIKARAANVGTYTDLWNLAEKDVPALIAEVERLRAGRAS